MSATPRDAAIERLERDGLVRRDALRLEDGGAYRATRKLQGAVARAALALLQDGHDGEDLRVPIAAALVEVYGEEVPADDLVSMIEVLLPIQRAELDPRTHVRTARPSPA